MPELTSAFTWSEPVTYSWMLVWAASAIWALVVHPDHKVMLMELGAAEKLVKLLEEGTPAAKECAAGAIKNLAINSDNAALKHDK